MSHFPSFTHPLQDISWVQNKVEVWFSNLTCLPDNFAHPTTPQQTHFLMLSPELWSVGWRQEGPGGRTMPEKLWSGMWNKMCLILLLIHPFGWGSTEPQRILKYTSSTLPPSVFCHKRSDYKLLPLHTATDWNFILFPPCHGRPLGVWGRRIFHGECIKCERCEKCEEKFLWKAKSFECKWGGRSWWECLVIIVLEFPYEKGIKRFGIKGKSLNVSEKVRKIIWA